MISSDLRPLGIGEILDRAVTVFVRHFAVIVFILALVAVPLAIVQYAASPSTDSFFTDLQRALNVPPGHTAERDAILRELSAKNRVGAVTFLIVLVAGVLGALASTACTIAIAQAYRGGVPSVREVYREALRRWLPQLAAILIFVGVAVVVVIIEIIVIALAAVAVVALSSVSRIAGIALGIPVALVVIPGYFLSIVCLYFVAQMTSVSIALEEPNPIRGIAHGVRRTLAPAVFWRSALVGTIAFAVSLIGALVLLSIGGVLAALTHFSALAPVVSVVGGLAINGLVATFLVVYATDVRVRREGYDLELAARETAV